MSGVRHTNDLNPRTDPPLDFPDRDFGELAPDDYAELGFMCGLEVHQQLATRGKLFCRCPAGVRSSRVDAEVLRHMRPTLSELGEYDGTALMEFKTRKEIVYRLDRRTVCTYEIDDTPPFAIDEQAVRIALEVARLCKLDMVSELHVMRKQYLDGSIPTGFQRTAMVALGGTIPFPESELGRDRELRLRQLSLEEDSCREVSDLGHRIVFRTDRLGMPLTETVTEPELLTPNDSGMGVLALARIARSTGKVLRGPGAARQDVNVSIAGGRRVEIKGVHSHRRVPKLVHIEAFRQLNLLRVRAELLRRGVTAEAFAIPERGRPWEVSELVVDARSMVRRCSYAPVTHSLERDEMICAVRLPEFRGLLAHGTQPGITFARELSGRVRVIACLQSRPFMIHSDVKDYGLPGYVWQHLRQATKAESTDAIVVLWGPADDVATGAREVLARAAEALVGVPAETRQSFPDGTTGFERILPGADRMYPDTDTPPVPIPDQWVEQIDSNLAERPWELAARYRELGLSVPTAWRLAGARWAPLFDLVAPAAGAVARRVAAAFEQRLTRIYPLPDARVVAALVRELEADSADAESGCPLLHVFGDMLAAVTEEPDLSADSLLESYRAPVDADAVIAEVVAQRAELRSADPGAALRWAMGCAMSSLRGRVEPREVMSRLAQALELEVPK